MDPRLEVPKVLLSTDLVDSTLLNDCLGDAAMADWWLAHDRMARDHIRRWRGLEIGRSDGFLILFERVDDALGCALDYHRGLAALAPPLRSRAGIHVGPLRLRHNDAADVDLGATPYEVDGLALPLAVRVMAVALGGQTLLTAAAFAALGAPPLKTVSHGHWRLKGVAEPVELFEAGGDDAPFAPPPDGAKAYRVVRERDIWLPVRQLPNTLPAERDAFVGRAPLLAELAARFDGGARLVTLLGPGGIGKTRLASHFARAWLGDFPGGAWFCDLASATDADGVLRGVAQGLELPLGKDDPLRQLGEAIAGRGECLLVLDNLEQVQAAAVPMLAAWLARAAAARMLVTSRALLGLPGEQVVDLPPLSSAEATDLFRRRGHAIGGADAEPSTLAALVELLDRLPLAIELAAARTRLMTPATLLERMGERFRLLARIGGLRDRQATLRATLDWSWDLLRAAERATLAQLSVFEDGFTLEAAEAVLDVGQDHWAGDLVQSLADQSLLRRSPGGRLGMLRSVHDYAAQRATESGSAGKAARQRHWQYFAGLDEVDLTAHRCDDIENLVAACRRAAGGGDTAAAARLLERAGAVLSIAGPIGTLRELAVELLTQAGLEDAGRAAAERMHGNALLALGRRDEAVASYRRGIAAAQAGGDEVQRVRLHCALADPLMRGGERAEAQALLDAALVTARRLGHGLLEYLALNAFGALALSAGRHTQAAACYTEALAVARQGGLRRYEGGVQGNLGVVLHLQDRRDEAAACYRAALAIAEATGDRHWAANARCNLGLVLSESGRAEEAERELLAVCEEAREMGQSPLEATTLCNLGLLRLDAGRSVEAVAPLADAAAIALRVGDTRLASLCLRSQARALGEHGALEQADTVLIQAAALAQGAGDTEEQARALAQRSVLTQRRGDGALAWQLGLQVQELAGRLSATVRAEVEHALSARG